MKKRSKRIAVVSLFLLISFLVSSLYAFASEKEYAWFCIRSGNKQPPITGAEKIINSYGGFSVDRSVNDTSDRKVIYLTFDAGYENGNVSKILDTLKEEEVTAAFFLLDNIILKNTDLVTRMANEGHLVCNHTKNHKNLSSADEKTIKEDINALENIYNEKTGLKMEKFFRFPEGRYSESALRVINDLGYKTVFWSFAYADWDNSRQPCKENALAKILSNTHNGAVILLHPTSDVNAEIMPDLIKEWKKMGYEFGSLKDVSV